MNPLADDKRFNPVPRERAGYFFVAFCILMAVGCSATSRLSLGAGTSVFWAVSSDKQIVRSLSVKKDGAPIDLDSIAYLSIDDVEIGERSIRLLYAPTLEDQARLLESEGTRQLISLATDWLSRAFDGDVRPVQLLVHLVPSEAAFAADVQAPMQDAIRMSLFFAHSAGGLEEGRRALKGHLATALHESIHVAQEVRSPTMSRAMREEQAFLVESCFRVEALSGYEHLRPGAASGGALNPAFNASNRAADRAVAKIVSIIGPDGVRADEVQKRARVAAYCREELGF